MKTLLIRAMGREASDHLNGALVSHLNSIHETFQVLDQTLASTLEKVEWKEVMQIGEQVSKQATIGPNADLMSSNIPINPTKLSIKGIYSKTIYLIFGVQNIVCKIITQNHIYSFHIPFSNYFILYSYIYVYYTNSGGTSIDPSVQQTGMGLIKSNPGINNTINKDISQAWMNMNTALLDIGNSINTNVILESDHCATIVNSFAILSANTAAHKLSNKLLTFEQQEKRDLTNTKRRQAYANKQREKILVEQAFGGTSIDQSVEQNGMGLIISNPGISNTINRYISQACLIVNTALLATGNAIGTNVMLESDQSATTVNPSAIVSANITGMPT
ncbi:hypothetical protein GIB67_038727 [Kingdonia uniflora]|uniref:Uncharacterized protein n=1 Tax=Kingdonia uniflora TaxID=39325 RepID=A0A7J7NT85_9MAGN|nr:hypothetical protein GIB67_038727 [Kingdonia uniflora]